jgi:sugar diacid utilization regulator
VLKIKKSRTLDWLFTKEELTSCLNTVNRPEWEEGLELITQLKFLEQLVELLAIFLTTCSHDIDFLNQAE